MCVMLTWQFDIGTDDFSKKNLEHQETVFYILFEKKKIVP